MTDCITKSGMKKVIASKGMNTAGNAYEAAEELLQSILKSACERAKKNGRKTVMAHDIA